MSKRMILIAVAVLGVLSLLVPTSRGQAQASPVPQMNTNVTFQVIIGAALSGNVDVWLDGAITKATNVKPLNASGFVVTTSGSHTITLTDTGTNTQVGTAEPVNLAALSDTSVALLPDMTWTTIADLGVSPLAGQATAQVINLSPNTTPVDVTIDGAVPATFLGTAYPLASASYLAIPAGSHVVSIPGSMAAPVTHYFQSVHVYSILIFWDPANSLPKILVSTEFSFTKQFYIPMGFKE